jgi:integrase
MIWPSTTFRLASLSTNGSGPERIKQQVIYDTVIEYADAPRLRKVATHDVRRTCTKLTHKDGSRLNQIQLFLGDGSIQTTGRYVGIERDLTAPCDQSLTPTRGASTGTDIA